MENFIVFLDAGHGGLHPGSGAYQTAPAKQWKHEAGEFHRGGWFFEGVFNRDLTNRVGMRLQTLGVPYYVVSHDYLDTPLRVRVDSANLMAQAFRHSIYISNHSNAEGTGAARGFEVYTSPGSTLADHLAAIHYVNIDNLLGDRVRMRSDRSDGDNDREASFYVLRKTHMPAMLVEHLFFDNIHDACLLMEEDVIDLFAEAQVRTILQWKQQYA